ncbi:MAG: DNA polymerase III subunit gamma/tau, partial [Burkholderiales bacterium]|nr:DNA polymerase III subunit gamma/tau [Burkholderiales bacterium]
MSYQVLARKYRPKSFDTLVGQEHVVRALTHALDQQRLHHAYLFTGTRGVGKTTLSRILAKSFNCEKGITSQACGQCEACVAIDAGRFVDYIEMDAASNRGVDEMASLLEQAIYSPSNARFKVYMIDEVHMLTNHAFNAMLKTLEEPPEHVKFILATTDPQKIPVTVLSRCLQFNLKQMPPGHIVGHLENILGQETIDFEVPALRLLAQGAHGSMRDALSLTDQAIAYAAGKVSLDAVQNMLGALDQSYLIRLLDALANEDGAGLLAVADEMAARSLSYKAALQDLGSLLHQIAVAQLVPAALAEDLPERAELLRLSQLFSKEEVQLFYQIAVHGRNEIGLAPDEYAGFSMSLLRMLAFRPGSLDATSTSPTAGGHGHGQSRALPSAMPAATSAPRPVATPARAATTQQTAASQAPVLPTVASQIKPSNVASATVAPTPVAGAKPMSPAMAALAAARAASSQKTGQNAPRALPPLPVVAAPAPTTPVVVMPAQVAPPVQVVVEESAASTMPPPWDDLDYELSQASEQAKASSQAHEWVESEPKSVTQRTEPRAIPAVNAPAIVQPTPPEPVA